MCPDGQLLLLLEGTLDGPSRGEVEAHRDSCEECRRLAAAAAPTDPGNPPGVEGSASGPAEGSRTPRAKGASGYPNASGVIGRGAAIDRFLVLSLLGEGGMGRVYAAYDPELDRRVALKLLRATGGGGAARGRLVREARALGKLSHPNVVQVHDVGEHDGDVFIAMELVEGRSLDAWCSGSPRPTWQEVLAAYLGAARGLAAAHEKGIVHRDVKPSNILRGEDGRVRVVDFGLAAGHVMGVEDEESQGLLSSMDTLDERPLADTIPAASGSDGDHGALLTATGAVLGTPLYMAPEQFEGAGVGPASDQHSLCAALYEGLYGVLPFPVEPGPWQLKHLRARKNEGPPAAPPQGSPVPGSVFRALARGLAVRPEERFPSMAALAEALREEPPQPRPRWRALAAIGAAAAVVAGVAVFRSGALQDPCAHPERQLSGAWDEGVRGRVQAAFAGTGRSYAADTAQRVTALLDRYGSSWATMRGEVCEASRRGTQRRELTGLRDECLDRRLGQLKALTGLLAEKADLAVLDKAVQAAAGLQAVAVCADTEALTARVRPPEDPVLRARVKEVQPRVDRLEALQTAGKFKEGLSLGEAVTAEAGELPYAPLRAQLQCWMGTLRDEIGDYDLAKDLLRRAAVSAVEGHDDLIAATAWGRLLFVVAERQQRPDEAEILRALAPIVVRTRDERALGVWLNMEGSSLARAGKYAAARDSLERAVATLEKAGDPDDLEVAAACNNLGSTLNRLGERRQGRAALERGLAIFEKVLGPDHPRVAAVSNNLGNALRQLGDLAQARLHFERALAIGTSALGPEHAFVGFALHNLGTVLYDLGDDRRAADHFERALALLEKALGPDNVMVAWPRAGLGRAQTRLGHLDAAQSLLEGALALREKAQGASHPDLTDPLLGLAELSLARGQPARAVPLLERALKLHDADLEPQLQLTLAEALQQLGDDRPRARALAEEAREAYARLGHAPGLDRATRWLASLEPAALPTAPISRDASPKPRLAAPQPERPGDQRDHEEQKGKPQYR